MRFDVSALSAHEAVSERLDAVVKFVLAWVMLTIVLATGLVQGEESLQTLERKAATLTQQGKYAEASKLLSEILTRDADYASAYYWRRHTSFA